MTVEVCSVFFPPAHVCLSVCFSFSASSMNHSSTVSPGIYPPPIGGNSLTSQGYGADNHSSSNPTAPTASDFSKQSKKAKVLYDYDAADQSELSLVADEVGFSKLIWYSGA